MPVFSVPDMSCGHCKAAIEKALLGADPAAAVSVDLAARQVSVDSTLAAPALMAAMAEAGYATTPA